jgi:hypothetical protein
MTKQADKRERLAQIAEALARTPLHGRTMGLPSNIAILTDHFPRGPRREFDRKWCAAFVYHCCVQAGFRLPPRHPKPVPGSFAGVPSWLAWAKLPQNRFYFAAAAPGFRPRRGDIVVYDRVFDPGPHDHIGVVLGVSKTTLRVAEGNVNNVSAVLTRERNGHVRGYVRIPNEYRYDAMDGAREQRWRGEVGQVAVVGDRPSREDNGATIGRSPTDANRPTRRVGEQACSTTEAFMHRRCFGSAAYFWPQGCVALQRAKSRRRRLSRSSALLTTSRAASASRTT